MINKIIIAGFLILSSISINACDFPQEPIKRSIDRYAICANKIHVFHQACVLGLFESETATACEHDSLRMTLGQRYRAEFAGHVCAICKQSCAGKSK